MDPAAGRTQGFGRRAVVEQFQQPSDLGGVFGRQAALVAAGEPLGGAIAEGADAHGAMLARVGRIGIRLLILGSWMPQVRGRFYSPKLQPR